MDKFALSLVIGATMSAGFKGAIGQSIKQIERLGEAVSKNKTELDRLNRFKTLKKNTVEAEKTWKSAQVEVGKLAREMRGLEKPTTKQIQNFEKSKRAAIAAKDAFQRQSNELNILRSNMKAAGQSTRGLAAEQKRLGASIDLLAKKQHALQGIERQRAANMNRRNAMRGQMLDAVALGAAMQAPIRAAINFESAMADVRKVVDFETPEQFKQMGEDVLLLSKKIPMAADELAQIVSSAGRAGIARTELLRFAEDAAKMGVAFDMAGGDAGSAMTGLRTIFKLNQNDVMKLGDAINYLDNNMDATAAGMVQILNRAGSTAQLFGLTGQQTAALGATFMALKTPIEIAGTGMNAMFNKLATADRQGEKFQQALSDIGMSAQDLKSAIENDAQGALLEFLEAVSKAEDAQGVLSDLFGLEYSDDMAKLVGGLDEYKKAVALVGKETAYAGAVQKEYGIRSQTTANNLQLFLNKITRLGVNIGSVLLPGLNSVVSVVGAVVDIMADVAHTFPMATTVVVGLATGLIGLKIAAIGVGYAWTFVNGGLLMLKSAWIGMTTVVSLANARLGLFNATALVSSLRLKALAMGGVIQAFSGALIGLASRAIPIVIGGFRALTVAFMTNPIGLVIGGIALAAGLVIANWDKVKSWFSDVFPGITKVVGQVFDWISEKIMAVVGTIGDVVGWVGSLFGGDGENNPQASRPSVGRAVKQVAAVASVAPAMVMGTPNMASQQSSVSSHQITQKIEIHIHQQPGQDARALAEEIQRHMAKEQRGALYD